MLFILICLPFLAAGAPAFPSPQSNDYGDLIVNYAEGAQVPKELGYEVHAYVSVVDSNGNPIPDLAVGDFLVTEDSLPVELTQVAEVTSPISLILAIDASQSMQAQGKMSAVVEAATAFVGRLEPQDKVALFSFHAAVEREAELTTDHSLVADYIELLTSTPGGTCLYDAAYQAVELASATRGRRAVVLLTDGRDEVVQSDGTTQACSKLIFDDVADFAADTAHVPVYTVTVGEDADAASMARLAELTGGLHAQLAGASDVEAYFNLLSKQLSSQYEIVYRSKAAPGPHNLYVEVKVSGAPLSGTRSFVLPELTAFPIITTPSDGSTVSGSLTVKVDVKGSGDVNRLALLVDGKEIASDTALPFEFQWDSRSLAGKTATLEIAIFDSGNNEIARSEAFSVSVAAPPTLAPTSAPTAAPLATAVPGPQTTNNGLVPVAIAIVGTLVVAGAAFAGWRWWQGRQQAAYVVWSGADGEPFATLVLEQSDTLAVGRRFDLRKPVTILGRSSNNDIVLPDRPVSRSHAELREKEGVLTLIEIKSEQDGKVMPPRYGTFVNDSPVPPAGKALKHGDRIRLGSRTTLRLERPEKVREDVTYDSLAIDDRTFDQLTPAEAKDPDATRELPEEAAQDPDLSQPSPTPNPAVNPDKTYFQDEDNTREIPSSASALDADDSTRELPPGADDADSTRQVS